MINNTYLKKQLTLHNIEPNAVQLEQLQHYIQLLQNWNKVYNLIGSADTKQVIDRHIIDSLLALPYIGGKKIIDVGTGAGLPGIPLAIMLPDSNFSLLDSNGKKTRFITQVKVDLHLSNVEVIKTRVEEYKPVALFNTIISRAFANLTNMLNVTKHLCAPDGIFVALKGDDAENEMLSLPANFSYKQVERLPFVDKSINRKVVVIKQLS